jgi:peptidoglycan/xylan/chitin deacetylase (PgdA/CDA1 family)
MEGGPHGGRVGACALILAALLAVTQALNGCQASPRPPRLAARSVPLPTPLAARLAEPRRHVLMLGPVMLQARPPTSAEVIPAGRGTLNVPILMYHYIRVNPNPWDRLGFGLSVTPADFESQVSWLAINGYHAIDLVDLERYLAGVQGLPSRPVILTFDDGYRDFYTTAYPILKAHSFTAVAYVVSGFVGAPGYMTATQLVQLDAVGIEIGAHTVTHPDLTLLGAAGSQHEVRDSKTMLEGLLKHPVVDFCYPSGKLNAAVVEEVQAAGFQSATTTATGTLHGSGDRFAWTRVRVQGGESLAAFVQGLGPQEATVAIVPAPLGPMHASGPRVTLAERP